MASPFNIFRKNQQIMIAVLIGLSMFAFIVADSINASNAPIFLGATLGAIGLWLLSNKGGTEGWLIAGVGGIVGGLIGAFAPGWFGQDFAVDTSEGSLSRTEINEILEDQQIANEFLARTGEFLPEEQQQPAPFGFVQPVNQAAAERNAALTYLFGKKADEMGITLTDEAVQQFILDATNGELTKSEFQEVRTQMRVGTSKLLDVLREQLRVREAYRLLSPVGVASLGPSSPTPQALWNEFKKLKEEATVAVTTLPVEEFVAQVEAPSETELQAFFEQYKTQMPLPNGTPGFRVPREIRVAYLEILASDVREEVTPPTEEEVLAHYQANKARYEFSQQMHGQGETTETAPETRGALEAPRPTSTNGDAESPEDSASASASNTPASPTEQPPATNTDDTPPAEAAKPTQPEAKSGAAISHDGLMFVAFQEDVSAPKPAESAPASAVQASRPAKVSETQESSAPAGPALPKLPGPDEMTSPDAAEEPGADKPNADAKADASEGPSEVVLAMVREELIAQRVREALNARQAEVRDRVDDILQEVTSTLPSQPRPEDQKAVREYEAARTAVIKEAIDRIEKFAKQHDEVQFHFTPAMSYEELATSEDYPVGQALEWRDNQSMFSGNNMRIADRLFGSPPDSPLLPIGGRSLFNNSRYVLFKAADLPSRVPEFTEKGIQEQVLQAWKMVEARQLAEQRAADLVETANETEGGLEKLVQSKTVTGEKSGQELKVEEIGPFTWLTRSSVPSRGMELPAIIPTTLPQLPAAGEGFMETVFETTSVGKAGMAPSVDREQFYVVQVKSRTSEKELQAAREEFIKEDFFGIPFLNPFRREALTEARQVSQEWLDNFLDQHEFIQAGAVVEP